MGVFWHGMIVLSFSWLPELGICNLQNKFKIKYPAGQVGTVDLTNGSAVQSIFLFSPFSFLLFLCFPRLSELTTQLFLQAIHLLNCLLTTPRIYLYAWETSCLNCFRLPPSWQAHLSYLFGAQRARWLWSAKIVERFLVDTNKNDNKTMIRKSSRKQLLNRKTEGTKHCYLRWLVFYFKGH